MAATRRRTRPLQPSHVPRQARRPGDQHRGRRRLAQRRQSVRRCVQSQDPDAGEPGSTQRARWPAHHAPRPSRSATRPDGCCAILPGSSAWPRRRVERRGIALELRVQRGHRQVQHRRQPVLRQAARSPHVVAARAAAQPGCTVLERCRQRTGPRPDPGAQGGGISTAVKPSAAARASAWSSVSGRAGRADRCSGCEGWTRRSSAASRQRGRRRSCWLEPRAAIGRLRQDARPGRFPDCQLASRLRR